MSVRKWRIDKLLPGLTALLLAVSVFAMPQGVCISNLMGDSQCCAGDAGLQATFSEKERPCCVAELPIPGGDKNSEFPPLTQAPDNCAWTSTDPFLYSEPAGTPKALAEVLAPLPKLSHEPHAFQDMLRSPVVCTEALPVSALRRGSCVLRI